MTEKTLVQKMAGVMAEAGYIQKDSRNDLYGYASAEAVFGKVRAALADQGIAVCGDADLVASEIVKTEKGMKHLVVAKHTLTFTDGADSLSVSALGEGIDSGDKASMKANTAAVKYAVAKALLMSWGDDPEADPATDRDQVREGVQQESQDAFGEDVGIPDEYPIFAKLVALHKGKKGISDLRTVGVEAKRLGWEESKLLAWVSEQGVDLNNGANYSDYVKLRSAIKRR